MVIKKTRKLCCIGDYKNHAFDEIQAALVESRLEAGETLGPGRFPSEFREKTMFAGRFLSKDSVLTSLDGIVFVALRL